MKFYYFKKLFLHFDEFTTGIPSALMSANARHVEFVTVACNIRLAM